MDIEEAKKELLGIKKDNESKAMIINNNSSNMQIRWSNKDLKEMAEISQRCAREIRAIETVLSELENKQDDINILQAQRDSVEYQFKQAKSELEKKDKIIELMAEHIDRITFVDEKGDYGCDFQLLTNAMCNHNNCKECIVEYFTNKVEQK